MSRPEDARAAGCGSCSTIYLRIEQGLFTKPVSLGPRAIGWIEADIDDWLNARAKKPRKCDGEGNQ